MLLEDIVLMGIFMNIFKGANVSKVYDAYSPLFSAVWDKEANSYENKRRGHTHSRTNLEYLIALY